MLEEFLDKTPHELAVLKAREITHPKLEGRELDMLIKAYEFADMFMTEYATFAWTEMNQVVEADPMQQMIDEVLDPEKRRRESYVTNALVAADAFTSGIHAYIKARAEWDAGLCRYDCQNMHCLMSPNTDRKAYDLYRVAMGRKEENDIVRFVAARKLAAHEKELREAELSPPDML